jgi:hypothetical protein
LSRGSERQINDGAGFSQKGKHRDAEARTITRRNTIVIASSVSNGTASLAAAELGRG